MVNFENGTLVKGAYVVIDGIEHEVHMPEYSGNTPLSPEILNKMQTDLLKAVFPIGSTYITQENTNPNTILGFGTWERLKGKVCLGLDEEDTDLNVIGNTGGEKKHTQTIDELVNHTHKVGYIDANWKINSDPTAQTNIIIYNDANVETTAAGNGQPFNIMQPYEVVGYMWIRRA